MFKFYLTDKSQGENEHFFNNQDRKYHSICSFFDFDAFKKMFLI